MRSGNYGVSWQPCERLSSTSLVAADWLPPGSDIAPGVVPASWARHPALVVSCAAGQDQDLSSVTQLVEHDALDDLLPGGSVRPGAR